MLLMVATSSDTGDLISELAPDILMLELIKKRKRNWLGNWLRRNCLLKDALEGMVYRKKVPQQKNIYQIIDNITIKGLYAETKMKAEKKVEWRMLSLQ